MPVTVLLSLAPPDGTTKFVVQLVEGKHPETRYLFFSWWTAMFGKYDVFHVHWPEQLVRAKNPLTQKVKQFLFKLFMMRVKISRIAIVRTLHNLHPHEAGDGREADLLHQLDEATDLSIRLNEATPMDVSKGMTILHGHYIGRYPEAEASSCQVGRLLYFGLIRPYKGVERLVEVFQGMHDHDLSLRIVGRPTPELGALVRAACSGDERITSRLEFVADAVLAEEIYKSELVVLPYKEMHNSGAILVALSLARPVLAPRSSTNELLADEVGPGWVNMFDGELTEAILREALAQVRSARRSDLPQMGNRDWHVVGERHHLAYQQAVQNRLRR